MYAVNGFENDKGLFCLTNSLIRRGWGENADVTEGFQVCDGHNLKKTVVSIQTNDDGQMEPE